MNGKINILGVPFDDVNMKEATDKVLEFMAEDEFRLVCTPNPEIVMNAVENKSFMELLNRADMVVADGVGVVWASKYFGKQFEERVSGYDLVQSVFEKMKDTEYTAYFFGGAEGVAKKAKDEMEKKYPGLKIVGENNGYFDEEKEKLILKDIMEKKPDFLLVGLGSPKQEKWIYTHRKMLKGSVCIGIGGCFDVMAGNLKRAPKIFIKLKIEWLYRLISQPTRFKRMLKLPEFVIYVLTHKGSRK